MPSTYTNHHPLVKLARSAVETYIREHRLLSAPLLVFDEQHCGVFVSLIANEQLRGSVGTLRPTQPTLAAEVITNAVGAAVRDPRFTPVQPTELLDLKYVIDLITEVEPLTTLDEHNPQQTGLAVHSDHRWGVVLPGIASITTADEQLALALKKASIDSSEHYHQLAFCVNRLT